MAHKHLSIISCCFWAKPMNSWTNETIRSSQLQFLVALFIPDRWKFSLHLRTIIQVGVIRLRMSLSSRVLGIWRKFNLLVPIDDQVSNDCDVHILEFVLLLGTIVSLHLLHVRKTSALERICSFPDSQIFSYFFLIEKQNIKTSATF